MSTEAKVPISGESSQTTPEGATNSVERILSVAYELFSRRGIRDVGVNELRWASPASTTWQSSVGT
jgi:hypothetical protein